MRLHRREGTGIIQCACEDWQLEFPVLTPVWIIRHELDKHFRGCIIGAATKIAAGSCLTPGRS